MNIRRFGLLLACFWVILMASTATAGSMHPHTHPAGVIDREPLQPQAPKAVSPFEAKLGDKRLHCELLGHNPLTPCPHLKNHKNHKGFVIESECGGKPAGSIPASVDFSKNLFFALKIPSLTLDGNLGKFFSLSPGYKFYLPLQIDHPPKFI